MGTLDREVISIQHSLAAGARGKGAFHFSGGSGANLYQKRDFNDISGPSRPCSYLRRDSGSGDGGSAPRGKQEKYRVSCPDALALVQRATGSILETMLISFLATLTTWQAAGCWLKR